MTTSDVLIREMVPGEEKELYRMAKRSFTPVERLGASKPQMALVATVSGEVAGGLFLKVFKGHRGRKIGYFDLAFVNREFRGKGAGSLLYAAGKQKLLAEGCDIVTAMVRDDNVASWGLLLKNGFSIASFARYFKLFGILDGLMLWLQTIVCFACGMDFWVSKQAEKLQTKKELPVFFLLNALLLVPWLVRLLVSNPAQLLPAFGAMVCVMAAGVVAGGLGCLLAGRRWRFRLVRGGILLSLLLFTLGTFFPVLGRWYPARYEATPGFRRAMGVQATVEWCVYLLLFVAASLFFDGLFWHVVRSGLFCLLLYHILAFYPLAHFGGGRVWAWNKGVYAVCALFSFLAIVVL